MHIGKSEPQEESLGQWSLASGCGVLASIENMTRGKDAAYFSSICAHFESNKRSKEYVAHQSKVSQASSRLMHAEAS